MPGFFRWKVSIAACVPLARLASPHQTKSISTGPPEDDEPPPPQPASPSPTVERPRAAAIPTLRRLMTGGCDGVFVDMGAPTMEGCVRTIGPIRPAGR